jgi:hypothetical protein
MKRNLTDKFIRSIKPAPAGKSIDHWAAQRAMPTAARFIEICAC